MTYLFTFKLPNTLLGLTATCTFNTAIRKLEIMPSIIIVSERCHLTLSPCTLFIKKAVILWVWSTTFFTTVFCGILTGVIMLKLTGCSIVGITRMAVDFCTCCRANLLSLLYMRVMYSWKNIMLSSIIVVKNLQTLNSLDCFIIVLFSLIFGLNQ